MLYFMKENMEFREYKYLPEETELQAKQEEIEMAMEEEGVEMEDSMDRP